MSTLKVTNIQSNGTGFNDVVNFQNASGTQNGTLCRAWVNFDGTGTVAIRASFNVSSITDNGTGDYTVNFTNALADADYSPNVTCAGSNIYLVPYDHTKTPTTSSYAFFTLYSINNIGGGTAADATKVYVAIFR